MEDRVSTGLKIVTPSPHRVAPPCRHYGSCGGCHLQHASDAFVADWKVDIVRQSLAAHSLETRFRPIATSPPGGRRKSEISVTVTQSEVGLDLAVQGGKDLDGPLRMDLAQLADQHDLARLT